MAVAALRTDVHDIGRACFVCQGRDGCLSVEWGVCMGIFCFILLTGGVVPGVRSILAIADPWDGILATGGDCFIYWGQSECLHVEWGFCLGFGFFQGVIRDLSGGIFPGVCLILSVAAPDADIFSGGGACFVLRGQSECLGVEWSFCLCLVLGWVFCIFLAFDFI